MSILVDKNTRLLVQGITGREGMFHAEQMIAYGTNVVGGVTPGKGGQWSVGVPVFDSVRDAVRATEANTSIIYVPAAFSPDAVMEAVDAGISLVVCITEGIPTLDMVKVPLRLTTPTVPGMWMWPGMMPTLAWPGVIRPGQLGPISRESD